MLKYHDYRWAKKEGVCICTTRGFISRSCSSTNDHWKPDVQRVGNFPDGVWSFMALGGLPIFTETFLDIFNGFESISFIIVLSPGQKPLDDTGHGRFFANLIHTAVPLTVSNVVQYSRGFHHLEWSYLVGRVRWTNQEVELCLLCI